MLEATRPHEPLRNGCLPDTSRLPPGYALDTCDPDVLLLLRPDGTSAAVFSARGVSADGILDAAGEDCGRRSLRGILRRYLRPSARPSA